MALFVDVSYKGIEKEYNKNEKIYKHNQKENSGGFIDKKSEKKYRRVLKLWGEYFIENKQNSEIVLAINHLTIKNDGDILKDPKFKVSIDRHLEMIKKIKNQYKNTMPKYSTITMFEDIVSLITKRQFISQIKEAYKDFKNAKSKEYKISDVFILFHQVMVGYTMLAMHTINNELFQICNQMETLSEKAFNTELNNLQRKYKGIVGDIGYAALEFLYIFNSIKNIGEEIKKIKKIEEESLKKMKKGHESVDLATRQSLFYDISNDAYVVDRSKDFGNEDLLTVSLIIVGSIIGILLSISLIRRAIYVLGTIKTDIMEYIGVDVITISMNIEELKEKLENTTDEKERKRLQAIIDKQQKFVDKFTQKREDLNNEINNTTAEAEYVIDNEDKEDEKVIYNSGDSASSDDDYDILM